MQAYIHVTYNTLAHRGAAFIAGAIVLAVMGAIFAVRLLLGLP